MVVSLDAGTAADLATAPDGKSLDADLALDDLSRESCGYSLSSPWVISGGRTTGVTDGGDRIINAPSCDVGVTTFAIWTHVYLGNYPTGDEVYLSIDRSHKVGETFMPQIATKLPSAPCSGWTGGVTLDRDAPFWKVSVDLQCTSDPTIKWLGWIEGNQNAH